jgi:hypothetical protein
MSSQQQDAVINEFLANSHLMRESAARRYGILTPQPRFQVGHIEMDPVPQPAEPAIDVQPKKPSRMPAAVKTTLLALAGLGAGAAGGAWLTSDPAQPASPPAVVEQQPGGSLLQFLEEKGLHKP